MEWGAGALDRVVERLGCCIPHHVQMFFSHLYEDGRRTGSSRRTVEDVDRVYTHKMLSARGHAELSHFEERLKMVLGPGRMPLAIDLLTEAAVMERLSSQAARVLAGDHYSDRPEATERLREAMGILEHDGYLVPGDSGHRFLSLLLRDWWKARFAFGYVTAAERAQS